MKSARLLGSSPANPAKQANKGWGAVALSPVAPVVAETYWANSRADTVLRLSDYTTGHVLAEARVPCRSHKLRFSPDGARILALGGDVGVMYVIEKPWNGLALEMHFDQRLHDGVWLDSQTILLATSAPLDGAPDQELPCALILEVDRKAAFQVVPSEGAGVAYPRGSIAAGTCSPDGFLAYSQRYGPRVDFFALSASRASLHRISWSLGKRTGESVTLLMDSMDGTDPSVLFVVARGYPMLIQARRGVVAESKRLHTSCQEEALALLDGVFVQRQWKDGVASVVVYQHVEGELAVFHEDSFAMGGVGCALMTGRDRTLMAIERWDRVDVYALEDFDIVRLATGAIEEQRQVVRRLGRRRYRPAVQPLARLLLPTDEDLCRAAIEALAQIADPDALPHMLRVLAAPELGFAHDRVLAVLKHWAPDELFDVLGRTINSPLVALRHGTLLLCACMPSFNSQEWLLQALADREVVCRRTAAQSLSRVRDSRVGAALLVALADEDPIVRDHAAAGLAMLCDIDVGRHVGPWDIATFATSLRAEPRVQDFVDDAAPGASFLGRASTHLVQNAELPALLSSVEALATGNGPGIAGAVALVLADALRAHGNYSGAALVYGRAAEWATRWRAPQLAWRALFAAGSCRMSGDDPRNAWSAYRAAMDLIDDQWFVSLDEQVLRGFFADKWRLYDAAVECCLHLGYRAEALECCERGKARYLADLVARRHLGGRSALRRQRSPVWRELEDARAELAGPTSPVPGRVELLAVTARPDKITRFLPARWAALQALGDTSEGSIETRELTTRLWRIGANEARDGNSGVLSDLELLYQVVQRLVESVEIGTWPPPGGVGHSLETAYEEALSRLLRRVGRRGELEGSARLFGFLRTTLETLSPEVVHYRALAVREALDAALHHAPVYGAVGDDALGSTAEVGFVTRPLEDRADAPAPSTALIHSRLMRFERGRWRSSLALARGEIVSFREIVERLDDADVAHVQLYATERGITVWIIHRPERRPHGESIELLHLPELTLDVLHSRLVAGSDAWLGHYAKRRSRQGGMARWLACLRETMRWLSDALWTPIDRYLQANGLRRLRIVPHRGLHLIPFGALTTPRGSNVVDDYEVRMEVSASLGAISRKRERAADGRGLTAVSNPTGDLRFASAEIDGIREYFSAEGCTILNAEGATREALLALPLGRVHHHAGHAVYDWSTPLDSGLRLAGGSLLTLGQLFDEEKDWSSTRKVVLSACETAVVDPSVYSDECVGLASGFLFAGAEEVVASLWAVDDAATALLMRKLYERPDRPTPAALRDAQRWLRDLTADAVPTELARLASTTRDFGLDDPADSGQRGDRPFEHPFFWAGFAVWSV